ncbi:MAG: carboxymuconolactone decarboxylase [Kordiimonadales bacterium]|nr:MAG: carboxymuconolactone decarboxylase [Kordiimonadales bacterium]
MFITPLSPPYTPDQEATLKKWMPPGSTIEPPLLFRLLSTNPALSESMMPIGGYFLGRQKDFSVRIREIIILRVTAQRGCEYEWGIHVTAFAKQAELTPEQIHDTCSDTVNAMLWPDEERAVIEACDQLSATSNLDEAAKSALKKHFADAAILSMITIIGWYGIISMIGNSTCETLEPWGAKFPKP